MVEFGGFKNIVDVLMKGAISHDFGLIAEVHNSAKVWITYTEYTISESNAGGEILHLRYKNNITMIYNFIRIPISWSYM
jgi:hypothetical protein